MSRTVKEKEQQQTISLSDFETLQKLRLIGEHTVAARNDVTAKKVVSRTVSKPLADCPKTGLLAARAISILQQLKICFLKCRLSGSFRYPLLFRNDTILRRCLFIMHICYGWILQGCSMIHFSRSTNFMRGMTSNC